MRTMSNQDENNENEDEMRIRMRISMSDECEVEDQDDEDTLQAGMFDVRFKIVNAPVQALSVLPYSSRLGSRGIAVTTCP